MTDRPAETEYAHFYAGYVALVPETDILAVLEGQVDVIRRLLAPVPAEKETYRYAEGKWSLRQVLGHLVDGERVFGYRAFCFSRGEQAALPSFDEHQYVDAARADSLPLAELVEELASSAGGTWPFSAAWTPASGRGRDRERQARVGARARLDHGGPPSPPLEGPPGAIRRGLSAGGASPGP